MVANGLGSELCVWWEGGGGLTNRREATMGGRWWAVVQASGSLDARGTPLIIRVVSATATASETQYKNASHAVNATLSRDSARPRLSLENDAVDNLFDCV